MKNNRLAVWSCLFLSSCGGEQLHDPDICKTKKQFRQITCPPQAPTQQPPFQRLVSAEEVCPPCGEKKVSLSLSGTVPVQNAFFELARQSQVSIVFDQPCTLEKAVMYNAHNRPFIDVIRDLASVYGLRCYWDEETLHVAPDVPYLKTHNIQFLIGTRQTQTQTAVKTDIFSQGLRNKQGHQDNGTNVNLKSENNVSFWEELESNIRHILKEDPSSKSKTYFLNKYAGVLSVWGTTKQQKAVSTYLTHLRKLVTTQILIEAKIIEIDLTDEYKGGIEWESFFIKNPLPAGTLPGTVSKKSFIPEQLGSGVQSSFAKEGMFSFYVNTQYLQALATFMQKFGTVRTLANPRLIVLNNQSAVLKVARNEVFFELQIEDVTLTMQSFIQKAESRIQTVPIGLVLYVHPSVNFETGEIVLAMHPMISRVVDVKSDPAVALSLRENPHNIKSEIPVVQVREMDSVVSARENQIVVTGGLMEETVGNKEEGIPVLSEIPLVGKLFKYQTDTRRTTELVILLRLSLVKGGHCYTPADKRLYQEFTKDPRPIVMP